MLLFCFFQDLCKRCLLPNGIEPRIVRHGRIANVSACDDAFKKFKRGIRRVQPCQMPGQILQRFRIAERGTGNAPDGGNAGRRIAFDHGARGHHEVAHSCLDLFFASPQRRDRFVLASHLRERQGHDVGIILEPR
jgi:hypothetical protein